MISQKKVYIYSVMETFLLVLKYVSGPLVGALIGWLTNYIAVKMLFRPYYPKKIGKHTLPFTPGLIPKRQKELAKAIGRAVSDSLFTEDDIVVRITSDETKRKIGDFAVNAIKNESRSLADCTGGAVNVDKISDYISDKLVAAAANANLGNALLGECKRLIAEKKSGLGFAGMFLTDEVVDGFLAGADEKINDFIEERGREFILPAVTKEVGRVADEPVGNFSKAVSEETIRGVVCAAYDEIAAGEAKALAERLNVAATVEEKINAMSVKELEALVLSVMKKELNAIVALGALLGFLIGIVNIFI